jgi:Mrp family chromosome partitioning ATPase
LELFLLPAGKPVDNPLEIIQSERFSAILRDFRSRFDWILFDSPPAFPLADTMALKVHADGTLLVARADTTPREAVQEALGLFQPGHVIGIILNAASGVNHLYSKYYHRKELQTPAESLDGQRDEKRGVAENQSVSGRVYS